MADFGQDEKPDLNVATEMTKVQAVMPFHRTFVNQWSYDDDTFTQLYASRQQKSSLHVKFQK